jgi:predicted ester cyclase
MDARSIAKPHRRHMAALSRRGALARFGAGALVLGVAAGARAGIVRAQATPQPESIEAVARQAIAAVNEAMATGDTAGFDAVFASDVAAHPPHRSLVTGEPFTHDLAGLKAGLADIRHFFPDASITVDELIACGDKVAARVTFHGTPDTAALGMGPEASQPLEIGGLMYGQIADGRVAEYWAYFDLSAYLIALPGATHEPLQAGDQMAMSEGILPGESRTLEWTFPEPGLYQIACHEPGHYESGQFLVIEVGE